ncbi:MAG: 8-oxoguanine DNA glycosylase [Kosmotoga sp.]|nr:MAG: 8-oxoguanine DNA glycosylase [Kosmotoga sp.]
MYEIELDLHIPFNLDITLDCGQTFRWEKINGYWKGVVRNTVLFVKQNGSKLKAYSSSNTLLGRNLINGIKHYFSLDHDLLTITNSLIGSIKPFSEYSKNVSREAFKESFGLRILKQDPFEMVIEYLISTRNSIPNIKKIADNLSAFFPENRVMMNNEAYYTFPTLKQLKQLSVNDFRELKLAFRSPWMYELLKKIESEEYFFKLKGLGFREKLEHLMHFKGIGFKVASCVALFGYGDLNAFPVDIWVKRIMEKLYNISGSTKKVMEFGMESFSPYAGYYQEMLFRYIRTRKGIINI